MRKVSRQALVIILVILSIMVFGVGAFILVQIQNSQAPTDSSASGFGVGATRDLFQPVHDTFALKDCNYFFNLEEARAITPAVEGLTDAPNITFTLNGADAISGVFCWYDIGNLRTVNLELVAYGLKSEIDPTSEALRTRINGLYLASTLSQGGTGVGDDMAYYYGASKDGNGCTTTIFQILNDFKYAKIDYTGFGDCSLPLNINRAKGITDIIAKHLSETMTKIYIDKRGSVPTGAPGL